MRHVDKNYNKIPDILTSERAKNNLKSVISGTKAQSAIYAHDDVKNELDKIYFKKCGYCETLIINYEIEHYRPKSAYPHLSYEWANIFPVCHHCNNKKREKFPILKEKYTGGKTVNIKQLNTIEEPVILNPEIDFPKYHFEFNIETGEIIGKTEKAKKTIEICDLNSDYLIVHRKNAFKNLFDIFKMAIITNENNLVAKIKSIITKKAKEKQKTESEFSLLWQQINQNLEKIFTEITISKN